MMGKEYKIQQITDIFAIPEDKFADFVVDFKAYYHYGKHVANLIDTVARTKSIAIQTVPQYMTWIDDGKHDARIKITTPPKAEKGEEASHE